MKVQTEMVGGCSERFMRVESDKMEYGGVEYNSMHSLILYYVEVIGWLHTLASLPPRTKSLVGWAPQPVWT
jgi:hypothetical protein